MGASKEIDSVRGEHKPSLVVYEGLLNKIFRYNPKVVIPDSREELENLGFQILGTDKLFYIVRSPTNWTMDIDMARSDLERSKVVDETGNHRITQVYKCASWEHYAIMDIDWVKKK